MIFPDNAVGLLSEADYDVSKSAVVHVKTALPNDLVRVDSERVALHDMVIKHGGKQIVRRSDCMEITGKVKVQVLHRNDLCITAACSAALYTEARTERRLTKRNDSLLSEKPHRLAETDCRGRLSFSGRCRIDCRYQNELSFGIAFNPFQQFIGKFRFVFSVQLQLVLTDSEFLRNLCNRLHDSFLCNLDVCFHLLTS